MKKTARNDPCPCGSGKKYKHCCQQRNEVSASSERSEAASISTALQVAAEQHRAGHLLQAEAVYRQILQVAPNHPVALHSMGVLAYQMGKTEVAIQLIGSALSFKPDLAEAHNSLGNVLKDQGKPSEAIASYRRALVCKPDYVIAYYNLADALAAEGELDEAVANYRRALALKPDFVEAHINLGNILKDQGKLGEATASYHKALALNPNFAEAHNNLGIVLHGQGKLDDAVASYRNALILKPDYAEAYYNLGVTFRDKGNLDEAVFSSSKAITLKPDYAEAYNNLGNALIDQGNIDAAAASYYKALSLRPDYADVHFNLGSILNNQGNLDAAIDSYRRALSIKPDFAGAYTNLLFLYAYHALLDPHAYLALARNWEQAYQPAQGRQAARARTFQRFPLAGRRLRVGYVSGDFRQHAVSYFVEQLFAHHDKTKIELFAYSTNTHRDAVTERLQALVEHWVSLMWTSDDAARERIMADGIDVLIDLSGHTGGNRLGVFARRTAPVQAHYLGFFASTGLTEMDYWIGDEILTPPGTDSHFSEQVWRLPRVWVSYEGKADAPLPGWHPSKDGTVWLGSFNNLGKLTPATLALWTKVLHALPEGKLLLKTKELADAGNRQRIMDAMASHGIAPDRIELQDRSATLDWAAHMAYYDRLDIALDPAGGVGGGTTTCDALWMGVPVITLEGDRMASRMTASMLDAIGHPEWIASSEAEYAGKVVALARDVEQRKALRPVQRGQMAHSPLCDAQSLAMSLEDAYHEMFERWLDKKNNLQSATL